MNTKTRSFDRKRDDFHKNVKFLGMFIESGLGWESHIRTISFKIATGIYFYVKMFS